MRIKYSMIDKLSNLTSTEMNFLLFIARLQDLTGSVIGVYQKDVCKHTGMSKQSFYNAMRGLEEKGIVKVERNSKIDYDITILDNDFSYEGAFQEGYINLHRKVFRSKAFHKLKGGEKYLLLCFLKVSYNNHSVYRIGMEKFYEKYTEVLRGSKRVIRSYLHALRSYFQIWIKNGVYQIKNRSSVFEIDGPGEKGVEAWEHEHFVKVWCRRNKIHSVNPKDKSDTAGLIKQYRSIAKERGIHIKGTLANVIRDSVQGIPPKKRKLKPKLIHKMIGQIL